MHAGQLRERVAFDAPVEAPDGRGGVETGWGAAADAFVCAAHFRFLRGTESVMAARLEGKQPVVVTIRACAAARLITSDWRMRDVRTGTVYNIRQAPVLTDNRAMMELLVMSGVAV